MIQDQSFFCDQCSNCLGHGLVIEQLVFRFGSKCISCRYETINQIIIDNELSLIDTLQGIPELSLSNNYTSIQKQKFAETLHLLKIIDTLDSASASWQQAEVN